MCCELKHSKNSLKKNLYKKCVCNCIRDRHRTGIKIPLTINMHEFSKCNKIPGIYWLKQPIQDITIRIKLKAKEDILNLPTFEDFKNKSHEENLNILENNKIETYSFNWQEKVFSAWEIQKYSDTYNLVTETDNKYHEMIMSQICRSNKIFTYINEDYHLPLPIGKREIKPSSIAGFFFNMNLEEKLGISKNFSTSTAHLFKSQDNVTDDEQWMAMHIVLDASEYNEDSLLLFKQEYVLFSLYHNMNHNYILLSPDVNNLEFNSYCIEDFDGAFKIGQQEYGIEVDFRERENSEELVELLHNLFKKWEKKKKKLLNISMPPLGKKKFWLTFEIVSAIDFEMDNIYIEYHIKIPEDIQVTGDIKGRTHTSEKLYMENYYEWKYGHIIDLELECSTGIDPPPLKIFLEAISTDWWGRHNTQGYSYLPLKLECGEHKESLSCSRPEELNSVEAESRRFFVGGCNLIKDLDVLVNPQLHDTNFRYVSTGKITVRYQIITQAHFPGSLPPEPHTSASSLLKGAEAVLRQYKKAKATLAAATGTLATQIDVSEDDENIL